MCITYGDRPCYRHGNHDFGCRVRCRRRDRRLQYWRHSLALSKPEPEEECKEGPSRALHGDYVFSSCLRCVLTLRPRLQRRPLRLGGDLRMLWGSLGLFRNMPCSCAGPRDKWSRRPVRLVGGGHWSPAGVESPYPPPIFFALSSRRYHESVGAVIRLVHEKMKST